MFVSLAQAERGMERNSRSFQKKVVLKKIAKQKGFETRGELKAFIGDATKKEIKKKIQAKKQKKAIRAKFRNNKKFKKAIYHYLKQNPEVTRKDAVREVLKKRKQESARSGRAHV